MRTCTKTGPPICTAQDCQVSLCSQTPYCQLRKLCAAHLQASALKRKGYGDQLWRFCQQCGKLQPLELFEGSKRSCRERLARRRAISFRTHTAAKSSANNNSSTHTSPSRGLLRPQRAGVRKASSFGGFDSVAVGGQLLQVQQQQELGVAVREQLLQEQPQNQQQQELQTADVGQGQAPPSGEPAGLPQPHGGQGLAPFSSHAAGSHHSAPLSQVRTLDAATPVEDLSAELQAVRQRLSALQMQVLLLREQQLDAERAQLQLQCQQQQRQQQQQWAAGAAVEHWQHYDSATAAAAGCPVVHSVSAPVLPVTIPPSMRLSMPDLFPTDAWQTSPLPPAPAALDNTYRLPAMVDVDGQNAFQIAMQPAGVPPGLSGCVPPLQQSTTDIYSNDLPRLSPSCLRLVPTPAALPSPHGATALTAGTCDQLTLLQQQRAEAASAQGHSHGQLLGRIPHLDTLLQLDDGLDPTNPLAPHAQVLL